MSCPADGARAVRAARRVRGVAEGRV